MTLVELDDSINGELDSPTDLKAATVHCEYRDAVGRKTAEIDASGRTTRFGYDGLGRLILVVLPNPATGANPALVDGSSPDAGTLTTRYAYDEVGNKIRQTDAEGRETRWEYDSMGRETARVLPGGEREEKRYNAAGELVEHTDFRGRVTRYTYDAAGRLQTIDYPSDADHSFVYNTAGERIEAVDERGTSRSQFDARGRLLRLQDADGGVIEYSYDSVGNLLARSSPSQTLLYRYDARNRLIEVERRVQGEAPVLTRYTYDAAGRRRSMEGGDGTRTEYAYDSRHRLRGLVKRSALGALLMGMGYQVDADGLRTQISESDAAGLVRTVQYDYDAVKRLVAERIDHRIDLQDRVASWSYDRVGNRLRQSVSEAGAAAEVIDYVYDSNDRLQSERGASIADYTYDAAGNLLSHATPGGTTAYVYNDAGRMREARSAGEVNAYVYNADGLRVRSTRTQGADSETTWILQDPSFEYAQSLEHWRSQNAGPRSVSAVFSFGDELLSQTRFDANGAPSTVWLQTDGFGSTRAATDASGSVIDQIDYDAFGNEIARSGSTAIEHLYRGEAFDPNVGFYYLRARWMDPSVGRFLTQDPFEGLLCMPMSLHDYVYAHNDPVQHADPSGLFIGLVGMTQADFTTMYNRVQDGRRAYKTFDHIRSTLCKGPSTIATRLNGHHALPKFAGGAPGQVLADIPEDVHHALHQLLHYASIINGFTPPSSKAYAGLFIADRTHRADFLKVLRNVTRFVDTACAGKPGIPITPKIRQAIRQFGWSF